MRRVVVIIAVVLVGCTTSVADPPTGPSSSPGIGVETPGATASSSEGSPSGFLVAVGDIACAPGEPVTRVTCHQRETAALLERGGPLGREGLLGALLLGDTQYENGTLDEYRSFDGSWGRVLERTGARVLPVTGNHEYVPGPRPSGCRLAVGGQHACGFETYFSGLTGVLGDGDAQYVTRFGNRSPQSLVVIVLDVGRCDLAPELCGPEGPVVRFLRDALTDPHRNPPGACTLVAWHEPRWSEFGHGDLSWVDSIWRALFEPPARQRPDLVLNGHDHLYERYPRLGPDGEPARTGIPEIVVGTGGKDVVGVPFPILPSPLAAIDTAHFGVLRIDWGDPGGGLTTSFTTERGQVLDRADHPCHR